MRGTTDRTHAVLPQADASSRQHGWIGADGLAAVHLEDLAGMRATAMRLIGHLGDMIDALDDDSLDRLLGAGGLIAGFASVCRVVCLLMDRERKNFDMTGAMAHSPTDETELERRITDELDRIAARKRAPALGAPNGPDL
jgi:hypothetical protein